MDFFYGQFWSTLILAITSAIDVHVASLEEIYQVALTQLTPLTIPGLFVIVSWLSLFLPPESIPGRTGMAMTTLLTLAAMFGAVRQNTPKVSYVSALGTE